MFPYVLFVYETLYQAFVKSSLINIKEDLF